MLPAVRSELRKFFTTRMWWGMGIGFVAASALFSVLFAFLLTSGGGDQVVDLDSGPGVVTVYTSGIQIGYLLALTVGVMVIGSEFRHRTATATFLATPRRWAVVAAKAVALVVIGCFYGLLSILGGFTGGAIVLAAKGHSPLPDPGYVLRSFALALLVLVVWALIGFGVGVLIKNQVAALLIAVGFAWIVEPLAGLGLRFVPWEWLRGVAKFLPSSASSAVLGGAQPPQGDGGPVMDVLSWPAAAVTLVAYALVMTLLGLVLTLRRDVS